MASPARGAACVARSLRLARPNRAMSGKLSAKCPFRRAVRQKRCRNARSLLWPAWMTSLGEKADQAKRHDVASCSASKASRRRKNRALRRKTCQAIIRSVHFADNLPVNRARLGATRAQRRLEALACKRSPPKPFAHRPLGGRWGPSLPIGVLLSYLAMLLSSRSGLPSGETRCPCAAATQSWSRQ